MFDLNLSQLLPPLPRNTSLVTIALKVNGTPVPDTIRIKGVRVSRCANRISFATVTILDGNVSRQQFESSDMDILSPGNPVEILVGYHGSNESVFKGIIIRHALKIKEGTSSYIELECKDEAIKLTAGRKNKYYFQSKDSDIIEDILRNGGVQQTDVESTTVLHKEMVQYFVTDWDFIVMRAEANGMLVYTEDGKVIAKKPDFNQQPKFPLNFGTSIIEFEAEMDARDQFPTAQATIWKPGDQNVLAAQPGAGAPQAPAGPSGGGLGGNLSGNPPNTDYTQTLGWQFYPLQHAGYLANEEVQQWAGAQMTKSQLAKSQGRVKFLGVADIHPGECLNLQGVGQRHTGKVFVTAITHEVTEGGWFTHAQFGFPRQWFVEMFDNVADAPAAALVPAVQGLYTGVVTDLANDPDGEDRIQVRLPLVNAQGEGIWMRIACQDAGNNRGSFWRPEISDEVVVAFLNDDPRSGIVLGMLNSSAKPAPLPTTNDNHEKGWVTRSAMKWIFNDDKKSMILETPGGKKVTVDEDADKIQLEDEHGNKITLDANGIVVDSSKDLTLKAVGKIKIEGSEITASAQTNFKAEGQAKADLTSAGDVTLKGTFVKIN